MQGQKLVAHGTQACLEHCSGVCAASALGLVDDTHLIAVL